jgi:predicted transcriptional regulator YdeE
MQYIENKQFVVGIQTRTTFHEQRHFEDLKNLWAEFLSNNLMHKIPHRQGNQIIAIYTDYENEDRGEYTAILGAPVDKIEDAPAPFTAVIIPAGYYQTFVIESIDALAVKKAWQAVWDRPRDKLNRNFLVDFDLYAENSVTLYVGVNR